MGATGVKGIDVRQTANGLIFRASLKNSSGAILATGTTELRLFEVQDDGSLHVFDFYASTLDFTSGTPSDDEAEMTKRTHLDDGGNPRETGIWTYKLADVSKFVKGAIYIAQVTNSGASPVDQEREFQFGDVEGDLAVTDTDLLKSDAEEWAGEQVLLSSGMTGSNVPLVAHTNDGAAKADLTLDSIADAVLDAPYSRDGGLTSRNGLIPKALPDIDYGSAGGLAVCDADGNIPADLKAWNGGTIADGIAAIAAAVWAVATSALTTAGSIGKWFLDTVMSKTTWSDTKAGYLDAAITSRHASGAAVAKSPATIAAGDIATDAITAAAVKADAVTKIQAGLAVPGSAMTLTSAYDAAKTAASAASVAALPQDKTGYSLSTAGINAVVAAWTSSGYVYYVVAGS